MIPIAGFLKNSFVDFPGKIASVLFLPGCNYDCFYCHNRELLTSTPELIDFEEIDTFFHKRKEDIEGVVVTGGEPTLHKNLDELLKYIKSFGYLVKLDTNGSNPKVVKMLLEKGLVDFVAVDYKAPKKMYKKFCGKAADAELVLQTIEILLQSDIPFEVRTTVAPGLDIDELLTMAQELPTLPRYALNSYRKPEQYPSEYEELVSAKSLNREEVRKVAKEIRRFQPNTI